MKQYKNNELIQDTILEVHSDKTFRVTVNIYGQLYGWYSGVWVLNTDVVTWTRTASGPYPAESDPIDMDRIESVDKQKLVLQSAKYKNADPQILERVE
jgi:hypothetical protein